MLSSSTACVSHHFTLVRLILAVLAYSGLRILFMAPLFSPEHMLSPHLPNTIPSGSRSRTQPGDGKLTANILNSHPPNPSHKALPSIPPNSHLLASHLPPPRPISSPPNLALPHPISTPSTSAPPSAPPRPPTPPVRHLSTGQSLRRGVQRASCHIRQAD